MRVRAFLVLPGILIGLAAACLSGGGTAAASGASARADSAFAPRVAFAPDSLDRRIQRLLHADSLNLDSLDLLLREDSLASRPGALDSAGADSARARGAGAPGTPGALPAPPPESTSVVPAARRLPPAAPALPALRDSTTLRWETGASSDLIDEQFFEYRDEVFDTLSRIRVNEPETRVAGVVAMALDGTRAGGRVHWRVHDETSLGDLLQRTTLDLGWRDDRSPSWKLAVLPWMEVRHDRTFGRDLGEWHGAAAAQARRLLGNDADLELAARGEMLRIWGTGTDFLLDRNAATVSAALDRTPLSGDEARLAYLFTVRQFPDSAERDHLEHGWQVQWRRLLPGSGWFGLESDGERRRTLNEVSTTRDNFWRGHVGAELQTGRLDGPDVRSRLEGEWLRYDAPDSEVYGDEHLVRALVLPGLHAGVGRSVNVGPRLERLWSSQQPGEEYTEWAGVAEIEWSSGVTFWSASPAAGRRTYQEPLARALATTGQHTSYDFYEVGVVGDQRLPGSLRLRALLDGRIERHTDAADDTRSLYFSLDLRMLF